MTLTVADVAALVELASAHRLDRLEFAGLVVTKTLHAPLVSARAPSASVDDDDDDAVLYHSAGA